MTSIQPLITDLLAGNPSALAPLAAEPDRQKLLQDCAPAFQKFTLDRHLPAACWDTLWQIWLPLAQALLEARSQTPNPLTVGFLGGQGTGKTTLTQVLALIFASQDLRTASFSLDDLYLTYAQRQALSDRRLIWRGPPGTHDIGLGLRTLRALKAKLPQVEIPWFDKSLHGGQGDPGPSKTTGPVDFVLFEGWFVGARPLSPVAFESPLPEPIVTAADRAFARAMNLRLHDYLPLWELLDRLVVLHVPDYSLSKTWRKQAEHELINQGKTGMDDEQIDRFVEYFWKALHPQLFIEPLVREPHWTDWVLEIGPDHQPKRLYQP
ncbi:MAG: glycerate kinase [Alkalinema sp. RU_4_3]|nr:glycerate kinase [Alkalinema sp. RU_4_3]